MQGILLKTSTAVSAGGLQHAVALHGTFKYEQRDNFEGPVMSTQQKMEIYVSRTREGITLLFA